MTKPNATLFGLIIDQISALRSSLVTLVSVQDVMNTITIHIVLAKIDQELENGYDEMQEFKSLPGLNQCFSILSWRCQFLESRALEAESF